MNPMIKDQYINSGIPAVRDNSGWWKISLGKGGFCWKTCSNAGIIIVGNWGVNGLGELSQYSSAKALQNAGASFSAARQLWDFFNGIKVEDKVIAYANGKILGIGVVSGNCSLQKSNDCYKWLAEEYVRPVLWQECKPHIDIRNDVLLYPHFKKQATLVPLDDIHVERLEELIRESGVNIPAPYSIASHSGVSETDVAINEAQGFASSPQVRRAVEEYAMRCATNYFVERGYLVTPVGKPYDLECRKGQELLFVEVKGTQSAGSQVILTRNEVEFACNPANEMALFIMSGVAVAGTDLAPIVTGGDMRVICPWRIEKHHLSAISYDYAVPQN